MSTSYASTWTDRNGPPETTVESLAALSEYAVQLHPGVNSPDVDWLLRMRNSWLVCGRSE